MPSAFPLTTLFILALAALVLPGRARTQSAVPAETGNPAIEFLSRVEAKNAEMTTLQADFEQVREDSLFGDTVTSNGQFWYRAPNDFRASYKSENGSEIWMIDGKVINYIPSLKQVEIFAQETGDDAPVNQLLLGFGVKVEKILEIFTVAERPGAARKGEYAIAFTSKDLRRSLDFEEVVITFDEKSAEPRRLELRNAESVITMTLKSVKPNAKIAEKVFKTDWPKDAEVLDYSKAQ